VRQQQAFAWVKQDLRLNSRLRLQLALRGDLFRFEVADRLGAAVPSKALTISGARTTGVLSPKANLAFELTPSTTLFANAGVGFHSNDARDVFLSGPGDRILPRAFAAELGTRYVWRGGSVAVSLWGIDLESELVWVGDEGTTEPSGRTRRLGVDFEGRVRLAPWLWADADLNLSRGRFGDDPKGADFVPLAPTLTSTGGLTVRDLGVVSGGLRYRHIGGRPADESNTVHARGCTIAEAFATWQVGRLDLVLAIDNLFDVEWNEAQFATTSRLRDEPSAVTELNFTPGARRNLQFGMGYRF
jgi:outer membrane receptor protein involved in Fe transport